MSIIILTGMQMFAMEMALIEFVQSRCTATVPILVVNSNLENLQERLEKVKPIEFRITNRDKFESIKLIKKKGITDQPWRKYRRK